MVSLMFFKVCSFDIALWRWIAINVSFENGSAVVRSALPLLELQIGVPRILSGLPSHPVLKNVPHSLNISKHLLHETILVPKLIYSGQLLTGSLPHIPGAVDVFVAHFHVCILKVEGHMLKVDLKGPLKD